MGSRSHFSSQVDESEWCGDDDMLNMIMMLVMMYGDGGNCSDSCVGGSD